MTEHDGTSASTPRRGFLRRMAAATTMLGGGLILPGVIVAAPAPPPQDDDWMRALTGKHRTVFDMGAHRNGRPLIQAKNYLDAWRDAFHVSDSQVNLVIGVHGEGLPVALSDAVWSRFHIGEQYEAVDPATKAPGTRNPFIAANVTSPGLVTAEQTVEALQKRGVRFMVCLNTIGAAATRLSVAGLGAPADVRAALIAGLLPGVITVPAMVVALTQLQERGLSYTKIS